MHFNFLNIFKINNRLFRIILNYIIVITILNFIMEMLKKKNKIKHNYTNKIPYTFALIAIVYRF